MEQCKKITLVITYNSYTLAAYSLDNESSMTTSNQYKQGIMFAFAAYIMWGVAPIYFKALGNIAPIDILLHRVLWSFCFVLMLLIATGGIANIRLLFRQRKKMAMLAVTSIIIAFNWLLFIWAINNGHMLDASLGYYINPLFNVLLGTFFLGEKLRKLQWAAVALAVLAVLIELISFGSIPWLSLALAGSFGIYGLMRKKINADAISGLFIETLYLVPLALIYLTFIDSSSLILLTSDWQFSVLLLAAGIVTTLPLLAFSAAAIRIPLSTLGFIQYIGPSMMLVLAVYMYGEVFEVQKAYTFGFIWLALIVYTFDGVRHSMKKKRARKTAS